MLRLLVVLLLNLSLLWPLQPAMASGSYLGENRLHPHQPERG